MPDKDNKPARLGSLKRITDAIQGNLDDIYRSTYFSDPDNSKQLSAIKTDIDTSIKDIMNSNSDIVGEPNISKLYERMYMNAQNDKSTINEYERIFGDNEFINNLASSYMDNRWIRAIDIEIDEILRYMPKLHEALLTMRDNVLSADSFSKDYLNIEPETSIGEDILNQFDRNIKDIKKNYKLLKLTSDIYNDTSKYGETFIYCVPYQKAIQRLMDRKYSLRNVVVKTNYSENTILIESSTGEKETIKIDKEKELSKSNNDNALDYKFEIESGIITSIVENAKKIREVRESIKEQSLTEQYYNDPDKSINEGIVDISFANTPYGYDNSFEADLELNKNLPEHHKFDSTLSDELELPADEDTTADGLYTKNKGNEKVKPMNGCIVKKLKRERVVPIIMDEVCLGYYYFEFDEQMELFDERQNTTGMVNTITGLRSNGRSEMFDSMQRREELLRSIASNLADKIDTKFVNANQDLKKEIYHILKYNDNYNAALSSSNNIRVTYIPPEDIHHFYFELDENTNRGISDLNLSLIPAKLWVAIYITNCLAVMTRGNDKRVYYVRQSVESNISKTLLKTINEIKKSNFGIRQIENINNVLNITGRFNDYIIPRGADGQSPIEFEVMQGQNVEIKTELLNLLEEAAINVTGVPIELIQNRQSPDYAMQLTMSNSKFLRFVYSRQSDYQTQLSDLITKLYNIETSSNIKVKVTLPPPLFINVTNTNQLIVNTNDYCENITNIVMADEKDDTVRARFSKNLKIHYLGTYIDMNTINKIIDKSKHEETKSIVGDSSNLDTGENT
jgi:hypothetical protein